MKAAEAMPPARLSAEITKISAVQVVPARAQPGEQQVAGGAEHGAQHQHAHHAQAHRQRAADEGADQRHDHAEHLGDGRHLVLGVAHVDVERIGHDAHHHVADAVDGDQRQDQHRLPAVAAQEVGEGFHQRARAASRAALRAGGSTRRSGSGDSSTVSTPDHHRAAIDEVGGLPGGVLVAGRTRRLRRAPRSTARRRRPRSWPAGSRSGRWRPAPPGARMSADSMRKASSAMSCVAEPKATASAHHTDGSSASAAGRCSAMPTRPATISACASSSQLRRRPSQRVSSGIGSRSTSGAHTHLKA